MDEQTSITLEVQGLPAPQGSKKVTRYLRTSFGPRAVLGESSKNVAPWREQVVRICWEFMKTSSLEFPIEGPLEVNVEFKFDRPKSHYGTGSKSTVLKKDAPYWITSVQKGDLDKLQRSSFDALSQKSGAGLIKDDSQITLIYAAKRYCKEGEQPGASFRIKKAQM